MRFTLRQFRTFLNDLFIKITLKNCHSLKSSFLLQMIQFGKKRKIKGNNSNNNDKKFLFRLTVIRGILFCSFIISMSYFCKCFSKKNQSDLIHVYLFFSKRTKIIYLLLEKFTSSSHYSILSKIRYSSEKKTKIKSNYWHFLIIKIPDTFIFEK